MVKGFFLKIKPPVNGFFYVGQDVTGTVTLRTKEPKKYASIQVSLTGETLVPNRHDSTSKWAREELLNKQLILWDRKQAPNNELAPGNYEFPFSIRLESPRGLPSTYESPLAKIAYAVEARVVKDGGILKRDAHTQGRIQVVDVVDINRQDLLEPRVQFTERNLAYTAFSKSPVSVTITLPRTGFSVHNDRIDFEVKIQNPNKRRIGHVCVQLFKSSTYTDRGLSRHFSRIVPGALIVSEAFKSQPNCSWKGSLTVPVTEPTISNCSSVQLKYLLSVALTVPMSSAGNMCMEVPITIGSVPIRNTVEVDRRVSYQQPYSPITVPPLFRYHSQPACTLAPAPPPPPGQVYPTAPLPEDSETVQATAPLPPGPAEGAVQGQWASPQWTTPPYWASPQASTLPRQWPYSPPGVCATMESEPAAQGVPPPSYEATIASGPWPAVPKQSESESKRVTHFD